MIDTSQNFKLERKPMPVDAQIMHRERNIIVVRAEKAGTGTVIQVSKFSQYLIRIFVQFYDLDSGKKMFTFVAKEKIVFWTWVTDSKLALVGQNGVYHADMESA